jgi:hypothetical protein
MRYNYNYTTRKLSSETVPSTSDFVLFSRNFGKIWRYFWENCCKKDDMCYTIVAAQYSLQGHQISDFETPESVKIRKHKAQNAK